MALLFQSYLSKPILLTVMISMLVTGSFTEATAKRKQMLKMVNIYPASEQSILILRRMGLDIAAIRQLNTKGKAAFNRRIEAVVSEKEEQKLKALGYHIEDIPRYQAQTQSHPKAAPTDTVYHSFDEPELGIHDQLLEIAKEYPDLVHLHTYGHSVKNRPLIAVRLTAGKTEDDGRKPKVLFIATHHAREWVATQVGMRLINYLASGYGDIERVTNLLDSTRIWVIPVANPDGYEYTFTNERLWRKNLRDNDGDGKITAMDGVDLNRNFPFHWGLNEEGSSSKFDNYCYRGPAAASEPETKWLMRFVKRHRFKFTVSYHSYGNLILYPWSWQANTPANDDPIFISQAGTQQSPAIIDSILNVGYSPIRVSDLFPVHGNYIDWAYGALKIPSYTVKLTSGRDADGNFYGFEFPDDEKLVQSVFEDNLDFAISLAESAHHPADPVSPAGIGTAKLYHIPITRSWGTRQQIEILADKNHTSKPRLYYSIDGGRERRASFFPKRGIKYNRRSGQYFDRLRATIRGQNTGSTVTYRIKKGGHELGPFTYAVPSATGNEVLIVAAEDYTGTHPLYENNTEPNYLGFYTSALDSAGYDYDVWDLDAQGNAPSNLEVLSHYEAVIWYSGDDFAITNPGAEAHRELTLNIRDFLNYENGRLLATGQDLAWLSAVYRQFPDDFFQYDLGVFKHVEGGGMDSNDLPYEIKGKTDDPIFGGLRFKIQGGDRADNQQAADSFLCTSDLFPQFDGQAAAVYHGNKAPFDPYSGNYHVSDQHTSVSYKRLSQSFRLPAEVPTLKFRVSVDLKSNWDFMSVEIHETGKNNWTTLPDVNGLTSTDKGYRALTAFVR